MSLVVLIRGLNVGGRRRFRPSRLAAQLSQLDVINIGAAGTFVVRRRATPARVRREFARRLPFEADIMICEGRDIARLLSHDFWAGQTMAPGMVQFVSILPRVPRSSPAIPLQLPATGPWLVKIIARQGRYIIGLYRRHMRVISLLGALDGIFGARMTTRNWNTLGQIARVLKPKAD